MHAAHLGHFLALQSIPRIDGKLERTLFLGLCKLLTRERVLSVYKETLNDDTLCQEALDIPPEGRVVDDYPSVFLNVHKSKTGPIVCLLRKLLELFNVDDLHDGDIYHTNRKRFLNTCYSCI